MSRNKKPVRLFPVRLFEDLNHRFKKIFDEEYNFDKFKVELRGPNHTLTDYGALRLCFSEKYNTDGVWTVEVQSTPRNYFKGVKFTAESTLIHTNRKSLRVKAEYREPVISANVDFEAVEPRITLAGVIQLYGWFIGSQLKYDLKNSELKKYHNVAAGYTDGNFMFHVNMSDGQVFNGSISQKINNFLETGVELGWSMENNEPKIIRIGCKYALNPSTSIRVKVNHSSEIGLAYSHRLTNGISITLSTLINSNNNSLLGAHKVGLGIIFEG